MGADFGTEAAPLDTMGIGRTEVDRAELEW